MRLRIVAVSVLELLLSIILYVLRGYHPTYLALLWIGLVLVVLGLFWR